MARKIACRHLYGARGEGVKIIKIIGGAHSGGVVIAAAMPRARAPGRAAGAALGAAAAHTRVCAVRDAVKALSRALEILGCDDPADSLRRRKKPAGVDDAGKSRGGSSAAAHPRSSSHSGAAAAAGDTGAPSAARKRRERRARA